MITKTVEDVCDGMAELPDELAKKLDEDARGTKLEEVLLDEGGLEISGELGWVEALEMEEVV